VPEAADAAARPRFRLSAILNSYDNRLTLVAGLITALLGYDRLAAGFIAPYLVPALNLNNTQLGLLYSIVAFTAALSGYVAGRLSDRANVRKPIIVAGLAVFCVCALTTSLVSSFVLLIVLRFVVGLTLGPLATLTNTLITTQSSDHRRGLNVGLQTLTMFLLSSMLGPILATQLAATWDWRATFLFSAGPALLLALLAAALLKEGGSGHAMAAASEAEAPSRTDRSKNIPLCVLYSMMFMSWLVLNNTFLPLFLVEVRHFTPQESSTLFAILGVAAMTGGFLLPVLSDHLGRKRMLMFAGGAAILAPILVLYAQLPPLPLAIVLAVCWLSVGSLPLYAMTVPSESAPLRAAGRSIALVMGVGEMFGGVFSPLMAGALADRFGMAIIFWITLGAAIICLLAASALRETRAPRTALAMRPSFRARSAAW
jgi:MFS family permease